MWPTHPNITHFECRDLANDCRVDAVHSARGLSLNPWACQLKWKWPRVEAESGDEMQVPPGTSAWCPVPYALPWCLAWTKPWQDGLSGPGVLCLARALCGCGTPVPWPCVIVASGWQTMCSRSCIKDLRLRLTAPQQRCCYASGMKALLAPSWP